MSLGCLLFLFLWMLMVKLSWMRCIHDNIVSSDQSAGVFDHMGEKSHADSKPLRVERDDAASSYGEVCQPLRVHIHQVDSVLLSQDRQDAVKKAVQQAVLKIQSVLSVTSVTGLLLLPRTACSVVISRGINKGRCARMPKGYNGEFCLNILKIPEEHLGGLSVYNRTHPEPVREVASPGPGVEGADIVLYVTALATRQCLLKDRSVLAFASHCRVDERGRPIAGLVNFCPSAVMRSPVKQHLIYTTALHEIIHVLGFSTKLFDTFLNCKGEDCTKGAYIREVEGQYKLVTPTVVNQTRHHFGCHSDPYFGGPLQTRKSAPTSHWDSLMMHTSLMTAEAENVSYPVLDPITLAVLEDSGWYKVNFSNAESFLWGRGAGCLFATPDHCQQYEDYFCSDNSSGCHFLLRDKAVCDAFETRRHCGLYGALPQGSCGPDVPEPLSGSVETYSTSSRCFLSSIATALSQGGEEEFVGQCYRRRCGENGTVQVQLKGTGWTPCPAGHSIQVPGFVGRIKCPNNTDIVCMDNPSNLLSPTSQQTDTAAPPAESAVTTTAPPHLTQSVRSDAAESTAVHCANCANCFCFLGAVLFVSVV